jgi:hypothetical protein
VGSRCGTFGQAELTTQRMITDHYRFIRPDSVVVVLGGINSQGRCSHATGVSRARVVRCWRTLSSRRFARRRPRGLRVPIPDHCCGPGRHELSQERSQRSSMPDTCRNQGPRLSTACGYSSQRTLESGQPGRLQNGSSLRGGRPGPGSRPSPPSRPGRDGARLRGGKRAAPGLRPLTCAVIFCGLSCAPSCVLLSPGGG